MGYKAFRGNDDAKINDLPQNTEAQGEIASQQTVVPMPERKVKCKFCGKDFQVPPDKAEAFCLHCGKKNALQAASAPKSEKRVLELDAIIGKTGALRSGPGAKKPQAGREGAPGDAGQPALAQDAAEFQCPVCGTTVSASAKACKTCGAEFADDEPPAEQAHGETAGLPAVQSSPAGYSGKVSSSARGPAQQTGAAQKANICGTCGKYAASPGKLYRCTVCEKTYCELCSRPRVPPEPRILEAKTIYKYKLRNKTIWTNDAVKFTETLQQYLCKGCYLKEHEKALQRLRAKMKQWEGDIRRDCDYRALEQFFPDAAVDKDANKGAVAAVDLSKFVAKK